MTGLGVRVGESWVISNPRKGVSVTLSWLTPWGWNHTGKEGSEEQVGNS